MSKHTPGPWKLRRAESSLEHDFILHAGPHIIAWSVPRADRSNTRKKSVHIANAKLIAAAPELLEALREMTERIEDHPAYQALTEEEENLTGGDTAELSYLARVGRAAITKAEGQ